MPSLLLVTLLATKVTISSANMCIVNESISQAMADEGVQLSPCVTSNYSRTTNSCSINDFQRGFANTSTPHCLFGGHSVECYCSYECTPGVLKILIKIHSTKASEWEQNCGTEFIKLFESTSKSTKPAKLSTTEYLAARTTTQNITEDEEQDYIAAKKRLIKATSFKMFWIFCGMAFVMVCQLVLITMIRNEAERYQKQLRAISSRSSHLEAQRTSSSSSAPSTPGTPTRSKRKTIASKTAIIRGRVSHKNMPKSGDWYQFKKP
ncbi:unnamed protein product [Cylicocyclus nassatus]|uniref:Uncharacterized protein n=1 Tax=Cylicocyclus nassatus TaxID=53992 RepID=A0AA36DPY2_CYLNA|nr:unnamed protein product [Cylicocyclus nassatus]